MQPDVLALPGFEDLAVPDVDRAGAIDMSDGKRYTAARIRMEYPGVFKSVTRALFFYRLSCAMCADLFHLHPSCVAAIRDQVIAASATDPRAAFLVSKRQHSQRDIVLARLVDALSERLAEPSALDELSVSELSDLLVKLERAPAARNGTESARDDASRMDVTVVDPDDFNDFVNGLSAEKNSARSDGRPAVGSAADPAAETASGCSTESNPAAPRSFRMSEDTAQTLGISRVLSNSLSKSAASTESERVQASDESVRAAAALGAPGALKGTPGGGGAPAPRARGVLP